MVAPDTAEHIREFAARFEPGFPVLCDEGGAIVRSYALRNPNIAGAPHMTSDDVPFPGHLLIAPGGVVVDKSFTGDLRHRASATLLVSRTVGPTGGPEARLQSDEVAVAVELSAGAVYGGQEIGLTMDSNRPEAGISTRPAAPRATRRSRWRSNRSSSRRSK